MYSIGIHRQCVEHCSAGLGLIAIGISRRKKALVSPIKVHVPPVHRAACRVAHYCLLALLPHTATGEYHPGSTGSSLCVDDPGDQSGGYGGGE